MQGIDATLLLSVFGLGVLVADRYVSVSTARAALVVWLFSFGGGVLSAVSGFEPWRLALLAVVLLGYVPVASWVAGEAGEALLVERLAESDTERAVEETDRLFDWLDHDDPTVRASAARALAGVAEDRPGAVEPAVPQLGALLRDPDRDVRLGAASALAYLAEDRPVATREAVPGLVDVLSADDPKLEVLAATTLSAQAAAFAEAGLEDDLEAVARALTDGLADAPDEVAPLFLVGLRDVAEACPEVVAPAEDVLRRTLDRDGEHLRVAACETLGAIGADAGLRAATVDALAALADAPAESVREAASDALAAAE